MNSKKTIRNDEIVKISLAGILSAIIVLMTFIPQLGFITIFPTPFPPTIIHIPVMIGAILLGRKYGLFLGLLFGLGSMIRSFMDYTVNAPFTNPLLSVLPRMIFGLFTYDIFRFVVKQTKNEKISTPIALGIATLFHSLIVLTLYYFIGKAGFYFYTDAYVFEPTNLFTFIWGVLTANSFLEMGLAMVIGSAIIIPLLTIRRSETNSSNI